MRPYKPYTAMLAMYTIAIVVACYTYWWEHPHLMSYQEQYQLFVFTADYLSERVSMIGGLADYVGEFLVQFYYVPWLGALAIALTLGLLQCLVAAVCIKVSRTRWLNIVYYALSAIPSIMLWGGMGDENVLMSYPVALIMMQLWLLATLSIKPKSPVAMAMMLIIGFATLYFMAGPVAFIYIALASWLSAGRRRWLRAVCALCVSFVMVWVLWRLAYVQYPLLRLLLGLNYYRIPEMYPVGIYMVAIAITVINLLPSISIELKPKSDTATFVLGAMSILLTTIFGLVYLLIGYDSDKDEMLRYDYLVRNQQWHAIIKMAENKAPHYQFGQQAVNLALAQSGQLTERMFEFPQQGIGSLIAKYERNNTSCLVTAEAFYHLGMINSAFRINFDLQEAIMNDRKSGRMLKRMAECQIINGNYKVAAKYINKLKHSLYYGEWAKNAEGYLGNEAKIAHVADWAQKRRVRFKREMLYDYQEIEKVIGLLSLESEGANPLAWDYFNAALLLKNDLSTLAGIYHYAKEYFGVVTPPRHVQEGVAMYWTMGHTDFAGIPYPITAEVAQGIAALAQTVRQKPNEPDAWATICPGSYCTYMLSHQLQGAPDADNQPQKGSARGD